MSPMSAILTGRTASRAERERELRKMWQSPEGRRAVLDLVYSFYPDGVPLPDLDGLVSLILNHEFRRPHLRR